MTDQFNNINNIIESTSNKEELIDAKKQLLFLKEILENEEAVFANYGVRLLSNLMPNFLLEDIVKMLTEEYKGVNFKKTYNPVKVNRMKTIAINTTSEVNIGKLKMKSWMINSIQDLKKGSLNYNIRWRQFCISINGNILNGNLPNVIAFNEKKDSQKNKYYVRCDIIKCKKAATKECHYYHDPMFHDEKAVTDRNFPVNCLNIESGDQEKMSGKIKCLASDTLDIDVDRITSINDIEKVKDVAIYLAVLYKSLTQIYNMNK